MSNNNINFDEIKAKVREKYDNILYDKFWIIAYIDPANGLKTTIDCAFGFLRKVVGPYGPNNNRYTEYMIDVEDI